MSTLNEAIPLLAESRPDFLLSAVAARVAKEWQDRKAELLEIRKYDADWDGFDSAPPNPKLVDTAIAFLDYLRSRILRFPPVRVALSPSGTISIEWQATNGFHVEAEVVAYNRIEWMDASNPQRIERWTEILESNQAGNPLRGAAWQSTQQVEADAVEYAQAL
jgi:hypothetical protein